jgi:hypothetical protein
MNHPPPRLRRAGAGGAGNQGPFGRKATGDPTSENLTKFLAQDQTLLYRLAEPPGPQMYLLPRLVPCRCWVPSAYRFWRTGLTDINAEVRLILKTARSPGTNARSSRVPEKVQARALRLQQFSHTEHGTTDRGTTGLRITRLQRHRAQLSAERKLLAGLPSVRPSLNLGARQAVMPWPKGFSRESRS